MIDQLACHHVEADLEKAALELKYTFGYVRDATTGVFDYQVALGTHAAADLMHLTHMDNIWTIFNGMKTIDDLPSVAAIPRRHLRTDHPISTTDFLVLLVGRLNSEKGTDVFLAAARSILAQHAHIKFVIVGDGGLKGQVESMAATHPSQFFYLGSLTHEEVIPLYSQGDLLVDPSIQYHGFNGVVPEAMCSGTLVLGTTAERLVDEFNDGSIFFAKLGSPKSLAAKLVEISKMTRHRRSAQAKRVKDKWCPRFSLRHSVAQYDDLFRVMQKRRKEHLGQL